MLPDPRHKVMLAMPGPSLAFAACRALIEASEKHEVGIDNSGGSWDNFNTLFALALNRAAQGSITHFAMLHADVVPAAGWLDVLLEECDAFEADLVSAIVPLKDMRGVTSSGLGRPGDPFGGAWRRVCVRELAGMPPTFNGPWLQRHWGATPAHDLLHNNGCWVADLRKPVFTAADHAATIEGQICPVLTAMFAFPRRVVKYRGEWTVQGESEDWYFSRRLAELDANTYLTQRVQLAHLDGGTSYRNFGEWGGPWDEQTRRLWDTSSEQGAGSKEESA